MPRENIYQTSGLFQKRRVRWTILVGKCIFHQNPNFMEKPPAPSKELSPIVVCTRDEVRNGCLPFNARIRLKLVTEEFDFGTHGGADVILIRNMMGHFGCPFHGECCVPSKILAYDNGLVCSHD